ncbi:MAG: Stp1/IreP family PP2C-type Ser/Thr phosphatase [Bdellovibrionales bacterium]|nr:Stp1/IreP family PP2C-type Ser/Thr phosphatase [Bdellovibrionales bacterium]
MKFNAWAKTDVGLKRSSNEDSILIDEKLGLFIVADGMGGHEGGEVASSIAVKTAKDIIQNQNYQKNITTENLIRRAFDEASQRIFHKSHVESPELMGMGTTMILALLKGDRLYFGNVGDSRAYLFRKPKLWQISEDHSLVNEQIKAGVIKEEDSENVVGKNVITRSVGFEKNVQPDVFVRTVQPNENILLCSDGLSGMVPDRQMAQLLADTPPAKVVPKAIQAAKKGGGDDNISVIFIQF